MFLKNYFLKEKLKQNSYFIWNSQKKNIQTIKEFKPLDLKLIIGVDNLLEMFEEKYYRNLNGGIMEAFGIIFVRDVKIYLYPFQSNEKNKILNSSNIPIHPRVKQIYQYLFYNKRIIDLEYKKEVLSIFSREISLPDNIE